MNAASLTHLTASEVRDREHHHRQHQLAMQEVFVRDFRRCLFRQVEEGSPAAREFAHELEQLQRSAPR